MMAVQTPWVLWVSGAAALGVLLAHLLSVGRPPELTLPTTRFVPQGPLDAVSRARTLRDLLLLGLRLLAVLLAGAAFAGLDVPPTRVPVAAMLALDLPTHVADTTAWRDSVRAQLVSHAPVLGMVTSDGRAVTGDVSALRAFADSVGFPTGLRSTSSLSGALLTARREVSEIASRADSITLVLVSPLRVDDGTPALAAARRVWPGRVAVTLVPAREGASPAIRGDSLAAPVVREVAGVMQPADSAFARSGGAVVVWPDRTRRAATEAERGDSVYAVVARGLALVAPMRRIASVADGANARAWWPDGEVAVADVPLGAGCVRWVGFEPPLGDALLTDAARGVRSVLEGGCAMERAEMLSDSLRDLVRGAGTLASRATLVTTDQPASHTLARWLLLAALLVLLMEQALRSRKARGVS